MFQENKIVSSVSELLNYKFPNAMKVKESYRFFTSAKEEFEALRNGVGLRINSSLVLIQMFGKDVLDFLHRVSTNSLKDLNTFEKRNTIFLNEKGRFIDRTTLIRMENDFLLVGSTCRDKRLVSWVNRFIITEDIQTKDVSNNYDIVDFIGPQAESFLTLLLGREINSVDSTNVRRFDVDGFTFYFFMNQEKNGVRIYKVLINSDKTAALIEYLISIKSVFDPHVVGDDAYDAFRIENGIPEFPNEINDETNPHEINLLHEVCFKKGCYIGQEVIARLDTYDKVQKKLVAVTLNNAISSCEPINILDHEKNEIGKITTLSKDKLLTDQKGLALVRKKAVENDAKYFVFNNKSDIELIISELPQSS